ncbi:hypothetical protein [Roseobacter weihaiensis]|uniref:hypothetical protein n=1 Tax=Roseobacter weihaiensis TaxID=2763262 RepID=UPI001D0B356E|nr:hypothetical protein [Roseobacter sp. H9]
MRTLIVVCLLLWPVAALAQSKTVLPSDLRLWVEVDERAHTPLANEMVLITIRGIYRRHITREMLVQPDFEGFNWTQLGNDVWRDERLDGEQVKTFSRRMAVYPQVAGTLTIGAFRHRLTLTDERDAWFEHEVASEPVTIEAAPVPGDPDWWFPVTSLRVSDQWSNAPDQLTPGEGVLRVIRIEAIGVTPEMIPPMPALKSPSAMIFPHPDKRFVELSPQGPQSFAFWRWTIRPGNDISAIVEPLSFDYYDTVNRVSRTVTISPQRVAYGSVAPDQPFDSAPPEAVEQATLPGWPVALLAGGICLSGVAFGLTGRRVSVLPALRRFPLIDPLARQMKQAARLQNLSQLRRTAVTLLVRDGPSEHRRRLLSQLDGAVFGPGATPGSLNEFARLFLRRS